MEKCKKILPLLLALSMIICIFTACEQSTSSTDEGKYTLENIRDQVVGIDEQVELENGKKTVVTNFDNAATTPALQPVVDEVDEKLKMYGSIGRGFSPKSDYSTDLYNNTRDKVLEFVGADPEKYTVFYVSNTTGGLLKIDNAIVYGDAEDLSDRVGVITFNFSDVNSYLVAEQLSKKYGIATRRGAFCANPYVWRLYGQSDEEVRNFAECSDVNTLGMIRVSFGIYNTEEEVDYLLKVLPKAIKQAKKENKENFDLAEPKY